MGEQNLQPLQRERRNLLVVQTKQLQGLRRHDDSHAVQIDDHAGEIFRIIENFFYIVVRRCDPGMCEDGLPEPGISSQPLHKSVNLRAKVANLQEFLGGGDAEVDVILMRAQVALAHQFGNRDFGVDRSAELLIALPFKGRNIVGRGGGEGHDTRLIQLLENKSESSPPLGTQVMGFIYHQSSKLRMSKNVREAE